MCHPERSVGGVEGSGREEKPQSCSLPVALNALARPAESVSKEVVVSEQVIQESSQLVFCTSPKSADGLSESLHTRGYLLSHVRSEGSGDHRYSRGILRPFVSSFQTMQVTRHTPPILINWMLLIPIQNGFSSATLSLAS